MRSRPAQLDLALLAAGAAPGARAFELSHVLSSAMPVYHQHVPYTLTLHRRHGDPHPSPRVDGSSFANEVIVTSGHSGTHIDALGHFSRGGCMHDNVPISEVETRDGLNRYDAAEIPPIVQPMVLLDIAAARGVSGLAPADEVTVADCQKALSLQNCDIAAGDAVFIRTGWAQHWGDKDLFIGRRGGQPGPGQDATRWLVEKGATLLGSDTPGFECLPTPGASVHALLLVDEGIHIIENLNLDELAVAGRYRAVFIALPLRLAGSTGSPIRPIAIA